MNWTDLWLCCSMLASSWTCPNCFSRICNISTSDFRISFCRWISSVKYINAAYMTSDIDKQYKYIIDILNLKDLYNVCKLRSWNFLLPVELLVDHQEECIYTHVNKMYQNSEISSNDWTNLKVALIMQTTEITHILIEHMHTYTGTHNKKLHILVIYKVCT